MEDGAGAVVRRLRARWEEIEEAIFAHIRDADRFGGAGSEDAEYLAGLRGSVAAALDYVLVGIERGETWSGPIPSVAVEQARRAARGGVGLDTVLRRYAAGQRLLSDFLLADAAGVPTQDLRRVLDLQGLLVERLMAGVATEYKCEAERAGRSLEQRRSARVRGLLAGEAEMGGPDGVAPGVLEAELGYDLDAEHVGVIARGEDAGKALRDVAEGLDRRLLSVAHGEETVWAWLGGRRGVEMLALERAISGDRHAGVAFAVGEPARGLTGWRSTHQQAQAALVVALRRSGIPRYGTPPARTFTRYADVALLAVVLKDESLARALVGIYIEPLEDSRGGGAVLRETLREYLFAERSVSSAAAALRVTRKTVEGRLRTIEERLGRTLHPCPVEVEIALELDAIGVSATGFEPDRIALEIPAFP